MATTTNLTMQGIASDLFNRMKELLNPAKDLTENLLPVGKGGSDAAPTAPAGVSYERYEIDYLNVKLIEQGITGENRKASSSLLSIEAVHLTYERLQTGSGAGEQQNSALAESFTLSMTRAEYQSLNAGSGRKPAQDAVQDFLKKFSADPAPAGLTGEQDGLQEGQQKDLRSLELLLRTFTDKSDKEIRETIRNIAGAMRQMNSKGRAADGAADSGQATAGTGTAMEMVQVEVKLYASGEFELREVQDPLVIDLDGDGIELTDAASGVDFDLTGDGVQERTGTVSTDDAFLAYDRNGNGGIDSGKELFGDQHGAANGFAELRKFDGNGDAKISAADAVYGDLRLWTDRNANGVSEADELRGLADAGISAINLNYRTYDIAGGKNALPEAAAVEFADGRRHAAGDVNISYIA